MKIVYYIILKNSEKIMSNKNLEKISILLQINNYFLRIYAEVKFY